MPVPDLLRGVRKAVEKRLPEGWGLPSLHPRTRYHYFRKGRSLCRNWFYYGTDLKDKVDPKKACIVCLRTLKRMKRQGS